MERKHQLMPLTRRNLIRKMATAASSAGVMLMQAKAWAQGRGGGRGGGRGPAAAAAPARAASNIPDTEWLTFGKDLASSCYAPLDQINAANFNKLEVAWRYRTDNLGPQPEVLNQCTPLVVKGRMYLTAGIQRDVLAVNAATGELQWFYRHDEGPRRGPRTGSGHGVCYWTDGTAERILFVTPGYQLVSLDAKTGLKDPAFGKNGVIDLREDDDQQINLTTGDIGLHSTPIIAKNVIVVGAAHADGRVPRLRNNVKGYTRGFDVRTGKRLWIFHTIPRRGEFGYETWTTEGQAELTGNTGVWGQMSADEELGLVYLGVEMPTGDYVGIYRAGPGLFAESIVALDIQTGARKWHYQMVHHGLWDRDVPCAAVLCDIPVNGRTVKAIAQPTKQAFLYVLNRETGEPIWPIVETPVEKGDVPGEWYSPTQPIPSKPPAYDYQGVSPDVLVDFTPEIKARALEIASHYKTGPLFTPPVLVDEKGLWGTLVLPGLQGGTNWPGASYDPDTHIIYIFSKTQMGVIGVIPNPNTESDFQMVGSSLPRANGNSLTGAVAFGTNTVAGLPLVKPPYGRITAIDLIKGEIVWQVAHGETPDAIRNHPLLKGVKIPRTGQTGNLGALTTKTIVISGDGGPFSDETGRRGARLRAYDKATGEEKGAVYLPGPQTGSSVTYMLGGRQYIVLSVNDVAGGSEFIAFRLPESA
jgi:quinoprotein glucose dehydrogenase